MYVWFTAIKYQIAIYYVNAICFINFIIFTVLYNYKKYLNIKYFVNFQVNIFLPVLFFIVCLLLVVLPFYEEPVSVGFGFLIILSGIPIYLIFVKSEDKFPYLRQMSSEWCKFII